MSRETFYTKGPYKPLSVQLVLSELVSLENVVY